MLIRRPFSKLTIYQNSHKVSPRKFFPSLLVCNSCPLTMKVGVPGDAMNSTLLVGIKKKCWCPLFFWSENTIEVLWAAIFLRPYRKVIRIRRGRLIYAIALWSRQSVNNDIISSSTIATKMNEARFVKIILNHERGKKNSPSHLWCNILHLYSFFFFFIPIV